MYFVGAELEDNINVSMIFEITAKFDNIAMMQTLMDFDLAHEFLLGPGLGEGALLHNFDCLHRIIVLVDELIATCESSFA